MGSGSFFNEAVTLDNNSRVRCKSQQVEVVDNHLVPEIVIGPIDDAYKGSCATFNDWQQFERFVEAVNRLHERLKGGYK